MCINTDFNFLYLTEIKKFHTDIKVLHNKSVQFLGNAY